MGESVVAPGGSASNLDSEAVVLARAGEVARLWLNLGAQPLLVGLKGDLGTGKTTWVRGMLTGLGYTGRVPSPTYTLLEHYPLDDVTLVHVDLYRLTDDGGVGGERELESLGLRDWLAQAQTWVLVEWPERAPALAASCDVTIDFDWAGHERRSVTFSACSPTGERALQELAL